MCGEKIKRESNKKIRLMYNILNNMQNRKKKKHAQTNKKSTMAAKKKMICHQNYSFLNI